MLQRRARDDRGVRPRALVRTWPLVSVAALAALALAPRPGRSEEPEPLDKGWSTTAVPFLRKSCLECHDDKPRDKDNDSELVLLPLLDQRAVEGERALWKKVRDRVRKHEMPPKDAPAAALPTNAEREGFLDWTARALVPPQQDPGRVVVRRLNRAEYGYTVRDLLGVRPRPADEFPADDVGYGFDRVGSVLSLPPLLLERYLQAAEQISQEAILDWKPVKLHLEASDLAFKGKPGGPRGTFEVLYTNAKLEGRVKVPWSGEYVFRARAYQDKAGPDPARMSLQIDDKEKAHVDVPALESAPQVYETKVTLEAGERVLAAAFTNDYFNPNDPDPKNRDRNLAVGWLEVEGPSESPPLPWTHRTYVTKRPPPKAKPETRRNLARELLAPLASRAFRRPARPEELDRLAKLVDLAVGDGETWERGLQLALEAILVSPSFLFRCELEPVPGSGDGKTEMLDEYALASRLSYFVWSSLPDDELTREAAAGTLRANLDAQVKRLLADPKAERLVSEFAVQWLHLRRLDTFVPDAKAFPGFDDELKNSAREETKALVLACLRENRSVVDLVDAPFSFVNERLARHYGLEGVQGNELRRVDMPPERRGVLGHASVLLATSNPTRTSPVKRGRWVLEVILDDPPPPPLPGADSLKDDGTPFAAKSLRERLEHHRAKKECASCHERMDPLGFSLEHFDAVGAWRDRDGAEAVDGVGVLPDGTRLEGAPGLRDYLRGHGRQVARSVSKKLLVFALGRGPIAADDAALDRVVDGLGPDYRFQDLVVALVRLDAFHKRRIDGGNKWR